MVRTVRATPQPAVKLTEGEVSEMTIRMPRRTVVRLQRKTERI